MANESLLALLHKLEVECSITDCPMSAELLRMPSAFCCRHLLITMQQEPETSCIVHRPCCFLSAQSDESMTLRLALQVQCTLPVLRETVVQFTGWGCFDLFCQFCEVPVFSIAILESLISMIPEAWGISKEFFYLLLLLLGNPSAIHISVQIINAIRACHSPDSCCLSSHHIKWYLNEMSPLSSSTLCTLLSCFRYSNSSKTHLRMVLWEKDPLPPHSGNFLFWKGFPLVEGIFLQSPPAPPKQYLSGRRWVYKDDRVLSSTWHLPRMMHPSSDLPGAVTASCHI